MGYVVKLHYHPKKTEGVGYDSDRKEVQEKKIGKPFEDTPLEKLAAVLIAQMARRDVLIFDVEVEEYIKKSVNFKECKDGKGIILKGKRFSLDQTAAIIEEDIEEPVPQIQPHENLSQLYDQPDKSLPVNRVTPTAAVAVDPKKILYWAYYSPMLGREPKGVKLTVDKTYPIHQVIPHVSGRLDAEEVIVTDDVGRQIRGNQDWFVKVGKGLFGDKELGFSKPQDTTLSYGSEASIEMPVLR
jgi:hypothetical protein